MSYVTRFAPSPTGPLHLGHAYSAILAHDRARERGGRFLLRIEDIDRQRSKPAWEQQIYEDLTWLGLTWDGPVMRQSDRLDRYRDALQELWSRGQLFACSCSRRDIETASSAPHEGEPPMGPDGVIYPGTCRGTCPEEMPDQVALRLDMTKAAPDLSESVGDIVLSRKDFLGSYHLCAVLDDADQSISEVVRGEDLQPATQIHLVLQRLLGLPTPSYWHHRLIRDDAGKRLAKRDDARSIATYRAEGATPDEVRSMVGL
ncbi:glutamyl-Q-tRNA synthetase [Candidatus Rhodobacter oscarellae]|uniref:Glutamyl-Q-tRNA synthetase n=1 Tax=Candidatus Rhodobacter oscarellae TaxID=1675527 RepID=A0A0J9E3C4_9RHOB|nr:tRNA glutamyl-Q(34) synthetase GluQRS [Candidatus Rhodobacter lobularis]KMW57280.1 glutamyl-Q-tRNA synthetase [Candidatus Rhodobacter lobularis]